MTNLEQKKKEQLRWLCLVTTSQGGYLGVNEAMMANVAADVRLPTSPVEVRNALHYLENAGLLQISDREALVWIAVITDDGTDFCEYHAKAIEGIARPQRG